MDEYKLKKQKLRDNKSKLTDSIEKEKQQLIFRFESVLQKNKPIDAEVVRKLFPDDKKLYEKVKNMQDEIYKKYNSEHSKINAKSNLDDNELFFITQKTKKEGNEDKKENKENEEIKAKSDN